MRLYDIPNIIRALVAEYNDFDTTDERRIEIESEISALDLTAEERCDYYATIMAEEIGDAEGLDVQIKRLTARKQRHMKTAERFKMMIDVYMKQSNIDKLKTKLFTFTYRMSKSVKIVEGAKLAKMYLRFKDPEPDKTKLKEALDAGKTIEGVSLEVSYNLQIK